MPRNTLRVEDGERAVPVVDADLGDRSEGAADAGVVEQTSRPPKRSTAVPISASTAASSATSVRRKRSRSGVADLVDELLAVVGVEVADDDAGPGGEEAQHGRPADAAGAAVTTATRSVSTSCHRGDPTQPVRRSEDRTSSVTGAVRSAAAVGPAAADAGTDRRCRIGAPASRVRPGAR